MEVFAAILTERANELEDPGGGETLANAKGGAPASELGKKAKTSRQPSRKIEDSSPPQALSALAGKGKESEGPVEDSSD